MTQSNDRLDRLERLLERSIEASDERMSRVEQRLEESSRRSDERMSRLEQQTATDKKESNERLTRIEQLVESNNRFLSAFSQDLRGYVETMNNLAQRLDGVIATSNQDRNETNSRLSVIQRVVNAIADHLRVNRRP